MRREKRIERYLRESKLPFSSQERIFKDPMTTAAAIDRLVHHSVILELNLPSYRLKGLEAADEHRATAGGLMVRQATGTIIVVDQKNA